MELGCDNMDWIHLAWDGVVLSFCEYANEVSDTIDLGFNSSSHSYETQGIQAKCRQLDT